MSHRERRCQRKRRKKKKKGQSADPTDAPAPPPSSCLPHSSCRRHSWRLHCLASALCYPPSRFFRHTGRFAVTDDAAGGPRRRCAGDEGKVRSARSTALTYTLHLRHRMRLVGLACDFAASAGKPFCRLPSPFTIPRGASPQAGGRTGQGRHGGADGAREPAAAACCCADGGDRHTLAVLFV